MSQQPISVSERLRNRLARTVRASFRTVGLEVNLYRRSHHYVPDYHGRSAHKQRDIRSLPVFGSLADSVIAEGRTSHYYDRLHILYQVVENLRRVPGPSPMVFVEVGVYRGGTSHFIAAAARALGLEAELHAFDTFEGHPASDVRSDVDTVQWPGRFGDTSYEEVRAYLSPFPNVSVHRGRFRDTCGEIDSRSVHFAHVDVNLHEPTVHALDFLAGRLVPSGVIVVDDYGSLNNSGVRLAVDEVLARTTEFFALELLTDQCVLIKRDSTRPGLAG